MSGAGVELSDGAEPAERPAPRGAVQIAGTHRYVFQINGGQLHRKEISVGISNATQLEVLSGVQEGEELALPGDAPLQDNMAVRVENPA